MKIVLSDKEEETPESLEKARGIRIDRGSIQDVSGDQAFLLEYIITNGVHMNGFYFLGQMNIDVVFAISAGIDGVFYGKPPCRLEFSKENYRPEITLFSKDDGAVSLAFAGGITIIPGKYSTFILKDYRVMKLHEGIPYSFIEKMEKRPSVGPGLRETLLKSVLPMLKETVQFNEPEPARLKTIVNKDISPEVNIYVKYKKDTDEVYILAEICYGDYLSVNPFDSEIVDDYKNFYYRSPKMTTLESIEKVDCLVQFRRDIFKEHNVYSALTRNGHLAVDEYGRLMVVGDEAFYYLFTEIIPCFPEDWKVFYDKEIEKIK